MATESLSFKRNGEWLLSAEIYKKVNGNWVAQTSVPSEFSTQSGFKLTEFYFSSENSAEALLFGDEDWLIYF